MDVRLRTLKRKAESDPSYYPVYARALEQALGGVTRFEPIPLNGVNIHNIFLESYVADVSVDLERVVDDAIRIRGLALRDTLDNEIAYMVDVSWEESWNEEEAATIRSLLDPEFVDLIQTARDLGYEYLLLWG